MESSKALYPHGDVEMWADNDPKHTCKQAKAYMEEKGIASIKGTPTKAPRTKTPPDKRSVDKSSVGHKVRGHKLLFVVRGPW